MAAAVVIHVLQDSYCYRGLPLILTATPPNTTSTTPASAREKEAVRESLSRYRGAWFYPYEGCHYLLGFTPTRDHLLGLPLLEQVRGQLMAYSLFEYSRVGSRWLLEYSRVVSNGAPSRPSRAQ